MARSWLKPSTVRPMTIAEAAWLAGFFDGEGSLVVRLGERRGACACRLSIPNTDHAALVYIQKITGAGGIGKKYLRGSNHKAQWTWALNSQRSVVDVLKQMLPFLVVKRAAALDFLDNWVDLPMSA